MTLVSIRAAEIEYFSQFFSSFGTQSALVLGFISGSVSQVPGLALRGPLGSMVRAVEGMIVEQEQVVFFFCLSIFSFGFQCI
eukprot:gene35571-43861_t